MAMMQVEEKKEESVEATVTDSEIKCLDMNGSWEYSHVDNLENFLNGMKVGW
eukprot:CAMPEP_0201572870 /NCGR_PEP_ID=MMETSP0190_2-20130828/16397_1 /ASSEMBLY_ACC=CAM_ASM_000263 /TAXON_ID=37353 /ORGANISM="Rosalina sp." /LENGTH=51 /DNA_ID=CAMNT_0047999165 /DNA_START=31 /DNA_END=183 /DNA_ORIENTATION=+